MPPHWLESLPNPYPQEFNYQVQVTVDPTDYDIDFVFWKGNTIVLDSPIDGVHTAEWVDLGDGASTPVDNEAVSFPEPIETAPKYTPRRFTCEGEAVMTGTQEVLSCYVASKSRADYGDPVPTAAQGLNLEAIGHTTTRLYDKNMPCSAYLMKRVLCGNSNRIVYKASFAISAIL
jgi:hypothetical protein